MLQAVALFLIGVALLGVFGRLRRAGRTRLGRGSGDRAIQAADKCEVCGSYVIGADRAPCSRADCPRR